MLGLFISSYLVHLHRLAMPVFAISLVRLHWPGGASYLVRLAEVNGLGVCLRRPHPGTELCPVPPCSSQAVRLARLYLRSECLLPGARGGRGHGVSVGLKAAATSSTCVLWARSGCAGLAVSATWCSWRRRRAGRWSSAAASRHRALPGTAMLSPGCAARQAVLVAGMFAAWCTPQAWA